MTHCLLPVGRSYVKNLFFFFSLCASMPVSSRGGCGRSLPIHIQARQHMHVLFKEYVHMYAYQTNVVE